MSETESFVADNIGEESSKMATIHGNIEPYIIGDDFGLYKLRLGHFLSLNRVADDKAKVDMLASFGGADLYKILHSLIQPEKIETKKYDELIELLDKHFTPKHNIVAESFKFNKREQKEGETVAEYIVELKSMAQKCSFGDFLDRALRDRFICGIANEAIQRRLFNDESIETFDKACQIALTMETTKCNIEIIHGAGDESLHLVRYNGGDRKKSAFGRGYGSREHSDEQQQQHNSNNINNSGKTKSFGGQQNGFSGQQRNIRCFSCGRIGHIARFCFQKEAKSNVNSNNSERNSANLKHLNDIDCNFDFQYLNSLRSPHFINTVSGGPLTTLVNINGRDIRMEIDSGAGGTVISNGQFEENFPGSHLSASRRNFTLLSGESVTVVGKSVVNVHHNKRSHQLELTVVEAAASVLPLMGQDWLDVLYPGWREFFLDFKRNVLRGKELHNISNFNLKDYQNQLRKRFSHVFSNDMFQPVKNFEAEIVLSENAQPIFCKPYTVPYGTRDAVEKELDRLVESGILVPVKHSKVASPIVIVIKSNGTIRICVDCSRTINRFIEVEHYPLPIIDDIFASLVDCRVFCVLDMTGAYQQLAVSERSQEYLTINTHKGLYRFTRLAFGVASAPAIFQSFMDETLKGLSKVKCYFDDVCIGGKDFNECKKNLDAVLDRFENSNIRVNLDKCKFFKCTIEYLGHVISDGSLRPNDKKVEAVLSAAAPKNVSQLQSFIGMINYYAKFIHNLSSILYPLYGLLKKGVHFEWNETHNDAFEKCKRLLASSNVLALYDPTKEIIVSCDASPYGIGCVLSQVFNKIEKPVLFASSTLSPAEKNYSQVHREALAIVFAVKKFHKYIYGKKFTIRSDCQALREIFNNKNIPPVAAARLQRWSVFLSMYNYKIEYKSAFNMRNADGLSRLPIQADTGIEGGTINILKLNSDSQLPISMDTIRKYTAEDSYLKKISEYVLLGWPDKVEDDIKHYFVKRNHLASEDGCLFYGQRILVPFKFRKDVLELLHDTHVGIVRSKALARSYVWWPGIDVDIENWIKCCKACQAMQNKKSEVELSNWPVTTKPFERVHIDFYSFDNNTFLILVDTYSKWLEVEIMNRTHAKATIDKLRKMFAVFGLPTEIVSDNGPPFNSHEFTQFCKSNGIKLTHSPPTHPQSNGEGEVSVRVAKQSLKKMLIDERSKNVPITLKVTNFLLKYRLTPTTVTDKSPAYMIFNFKPKSILDLLNEKQICRPIDSAVEKKQVAFENNQRTTKSIKYEPNEVVSYQIVWNNFVKWVPAKILNKVSDSVYTVLVNGRSKTAHLQQLRKSKANKLEDWPGKFVHNKNESVCNNDIVEFVDNNCDNNVEFDVVNVSRKRKRCESSSGTDDDNFNVANDGQETINENKRSSRLENVPRPNYRETRIIKSRKKRILINHSAN